MYVQGLGIPPDAGKARALFKKACDAGLVEGCKNLEILTRH